MKSDKLSAERKQFLIRQAHKCLDGIEAQIAIIYAKAQKKAA
jgi:hypothetical protein